MATATGTTPSELIIDITNTIRTKDQPNTITPETHSNLLDNMVKVLSGDTYVNQGIFIESASTITFTNTNGGTFDVTGITSDNTTVTGGTYSPTTSTIIIGSSDGNEISINGISNSPWTASTGNNSAVLIGANNIATSNNTVAEGGYTSATTANAHAEGYKSLASGSGSHAEGGYDDGNVGGIASGRGSHAEGAVTIASGDTAHAEGLRTRAGSYAHSEGIATRALGSGSHVGGVGIAGAVIIPGVLEIPDTPIIAAGESSFAHFKILGEGGNPLGAMADYSAILGGYDQYIGSDGTGDVIIGGNSHRIVGETYQTGIFAGQNHDIDGAERAAILGGRNSDILGAADHSAVIAGQGHVISAFTNTVIIGGQNITATANDTVYVPNLNINNVSTGTSISNLGIDASGNVVIGLVSSNYYVTGGTYNLDNGNLNLVNSYGTDFNVGGFFTGVTISNTLFVDENGDDSTGQKSRLDKPFKTLLAARNAASSGDTIYIHPQTIIYDNSAVNGTPYNGNESDVNLWKDGVTYYFSLGTKIIIKNQTVTGTNLALFNPGSTTGETCVVDGYLDYEQIGYGSDTSNGNTNYFLCEDSLCGGCYFYTNTKKLTSRHGEIYRVQSYTSDSPIFIYDISDEQVWDWPGQGQTGTGGAYVFLGKVQNSNVQFTSIVKRRIFSSSKAYSFYIREYLQNSNFNIYGDYMYSYSNLFYLRQLYCDNINVNIKNIDYYYAYVPFALTGSIVSTGSNGGTWTLNLKGDLNDYQNNSISGLGLFYLQTGDGCVVNHEGNINTKTNSGIGRFIVGNNSNNCEVNLKGKLDLMGSGTTTNIILQAYSSGSKTTFTGEISGNYNFLAHPRLGGKVIINNSNISSTAEDFKMLDHTDTTTSTFRLDNTRVEGKNDVGTFADGQYLNVLINNSNIINTGSGDTMSNITDFGILQTLNSTIYSNSGLSINYPTLSDVISSNTVVNTDYSATTLSGEITKLTNLIN